MTDIKCEAACFYAIDEKCVNRAIELSYEDYGHMMCEAEMPHDMLGHHTCMDTAEQVCLNRPRLTSGEVLTLLNNDMARAALSEEALALFEQIKTLLESAGR